MKEKSCFILCRQSSGENDAEESLSISVQVEECEKLAKSKGLNIIKSFTEANTSGRLYPKGYESIALQDFIYTSWCKETKKTGQWREGLGEILTRLNEVEYIVVYDMTRFFRPLNGSFLGNLLTQLLQANSVKLLTLKEGIIDFQRFQDTLISTLTSQINSEQLRTQIEKSKAAYKRLRDEGAYYPGLMKMHGYKKTGRKLEVMIDTRAAEMVKDVFRMYINAHPVNEILRYVNNTYTDIFSIPCRRGIITKMLKTPAYCGYQRNSTGEMVKSKQLEGKEIVSVEDWLTANRKLESNKIHIYRPKKRWLPLSGYVFCGVCGGKMKSVSARKESHAYYVCFDHVRTGKAPCGNNIMSDFEGVQGSDLTSVIKPLLLAEAMKQMKATKSDSEERKELTKLELALTEIKKKMKKLTDLWVASTIDESVYEAAMKELKLKEVEISKEKSRLELILDRDTSAFDWVKLMMKFRGEGLTNGEYEKLVNLMIKKIIVYKDRVEVKTTFGEVSIQREKKGKYNLCRNFILKMDNHKATLYFHRGVRMLDDLNQYKKIATLGDLEVFDEI